MSISQVSVILVMGVSGVGKTTIGLLLAEHLGWQFRDGDDFHSPENIARMAQGTALTDVDRLPWLLAMQQAIASWLATDTLTVLACSALKSEYRQLLTQGSDRVQVVYLKASFELIQRRLRQRQGHYMDASLLPSQFAALEEPADSLQVDASQKPAAIVTEIIATLGVGPDSAAR